LALEGKKETGVSGGGGKKGKIGKATLQYGVKKHRGAEGVFRRSTRRTGTKKRKRTGLKEGESKPQLGKN